MLGAPALSQESAGFFYARPLTGKRGFTTKTQRTQRKSKEGVAFMVTSF
jgi:hypothetical protein